MLYKSNLLTLEPYEIYVIGWDMFMMSIVIGPKWPFLLSVCLTMLIGIG